MSKHLTWLPYEPKSTPERKREHEDMARYCEFKRVMELAVLLTKRERYKDEEL